MAEDKKEPEQEKGCRRRAAEIKKKLIEQEPLQSQEWEFLRNHPRLFRDIVFRWRG